MSVRGEEVHVDLGLRFNRRAGRRSGLGAMFRCIAGLRNRHANGTTPDHRGDLVRERAMS